MDKKPLWLIMDSVVSIFTMLYGLSYVLSDELFDKQHGLTIIVFGAVIGLPALLWKKPKSLLEILQTNGTGILEGTCRAKSGFDFLDISTLPDSREPPLEVNFSLDSHFLGCYLFHGEEADYSEESNMHVVYGCLILENPETEVSVNIYFDDFLEVSRFIAKLDM